MADDVEAFLGVPDLGPARCTADHVDYVDDMLVPIAGPASDLVDKVRTASAIIHMSFARFGFEVNYGIGKSEALMYFNGHGAKLLQRHVQNDLRNLVAFQPRLGPLLQLRVVTSYRHVGTRMVGAETLLPEARVRMATMTEAARPFISKVFRRTAVHIAKRLMVMRALLFSKGCFQCLAFAQHQ